MGEERTKKSIFKRWWFWALIVVAVIIIIAASSGGDEKTATDDQSASESEATTITEAGGSVTTKNFVVTVEAFNRLCGDEFNKPAAGNEFVEIVIEIENKSDKEYSVSSVLMFEAYQDGYSVNESMSAHVANESTSTMDGGLAAGKKIKGALAYELPIDWKELEVMVDLTALSFSTDGEIKIVLQNE